MHVVSSWNRTPTTILTLSPWVIVITWCAFYISRMFSQISIHFMCFVVERYAILLKQPNLTSWKKFNIILQTAQGTTLHCTFNCCNSTDCVDNRSKAIPNIYGNFCDDELYFSRYIMWCISLSKSCHLFSLNIHSEKMNPIP